MGIVGEENPIHREAWDDPVAKHLGIAYHEVGLKEYDVWEEKGFGIKKEDFELNVEGQTNEFQGWQCINEGSKHP